MGRRRGGFGTKVHVRVSGLGLPTKFILTPGQVADVTQGAALVAGTSAEVVIAGKGYDSQAVADAARASGAEAVIPARKNRKVPRDIDREKYKDRNVVERFWGRIKQYRRVATRYDKPARNFLGFLHLASIILLLE